MPEQPMPSTISAWFEANGDFEENLEDPRSLVEVLGDEEDTIAEPTSCSACREPNPARTVDEHGKSMCESCLDDAFFEPCCYGSTMHFGQGDHEWGCPNY